ncbi:hypothetical protein C2E20_6216 [Micractinium conductrix]|uniref:Uncharacterized protein n=1 Tax=Micractinium conductrix TaxID=554055 RepID=A0A2P6V8S0_9CHLO|nr:hypothetical protein C2E20_6216 [Micractinium conductrix]|eukprot:PSC70471.1 hypothetical protein C2E20_6216 [Micractinium conductrix]
MSAALLRAQALLPPALPADQQPAPHEQPPPSWDGGGGSDGSGAAEAGGSDGEHFFDAQECLEAVTDAADGGADSGGSDSDDAASVAGSDDDGSGWQSSGWGSEATGGERLRSGGSSISSHRGSSFEGSGWEWMGAGCGYASSGSSGSGSSSSSEPDGSDRRGAWWGALCLFLSSESDSGSDRQPAAAAGGRAAVVGRKSRWARENSDPGLYKQLSSCGLDLGPALLDWSLERFLAEE